MFVKILYFLILSLNIKNINSCQDINRNINGLIKYQSFEFEPGHASENTARYAAPTSEECDKFSKEKAKCYPDIGCFGKNLSDLDYLCRLPEEYITVTAKLFTKYNVKTPVELSGKTFKYVKYNSKIAIYFHGYTQSSRGVAEQVRNVFLANSDYDQVVLIDYRFAVRLPDYRRALANAEYIGRTVGHMIDTLARERSINLSKNIYFIGHSLGTHVSHFASKFLQSARNGTEGKIARLTALDPAAPMIEDCKACLMSQQDAHFVDIIHTSAAPPNYVRSRFSNYLGLRQPLGHVDFYPNGGGSQPTCKNFFTKIKYPVACSHAMSVEYLINSFKKYTYQSFSCSSIDVNKTGASSCTKSDGKGSRMGYFADRYSGRGIQYVDVNQC